MMEGNLFGMKTIRIGNDFKHLHQSVKFQQKQPGMLATFNFLFFIYSNSHYAMLYYVKKTFTL
ncbi:unnamed protein product [Prunus brigantina]